MDSKPVVDIEKTIKALRIERARTKTQITSQKQALSKLPGG